MSNAPERLTLKKIWSDLLEQFNLERGLGYTVKEWLLHPGRAADKYLYQDRRPFTKPFSFLLLTSAVTTFLMLELVIKKQGALEFTTSEEWQEIPELLKPGIKLALIAVKKYFNLLYLASLPLVTLASYWLLRKDHPLNLAEFLVINTFIFSIQSILYLFNIPFLALMPNSILSAIPALLLVIYFVYAYKQIFQQSYWRAIWYTALIYLIAQFLSLILFGVIVLIGIFFA